MYEKEKSYIFTCINDKLKELLELVKDVVQDGNERNIIDCKLSHINTIEPIILSINKEKLIKNFVKESEKWWDQIFEFNYDFFKNLSFNLFLAKKDKSIEEKNNFNLFKQIIEAKYKYEGEEKMLLDDEYKKEIFEIFQDFVKLSLLYIFYSRELDIEKGIYTKQFMEEIKLKPYFEKFKIKKLNL